MSAINKFIYRYAEDFQRLDADSVARWYRYPFSMLTGDKNTIFNYFEEARDRLHAFYKLYRSYQLTNIFILNTKYHNQINGIHHIDVHWMIANADNSKALDFHAVYFVKLNEAKPQICAMLTQNELFINWQKQHFF